MSNFTRSAERERLAEIEKMLKYPAAITNVVWFDLLKEVITIANALAYDLSNVVDELEKMKRNFDP